MASLLGEHLFEISGQGPPPPKDFFQLLVTKKEVEYEYEFSFIKQCLVKKLSLTKTLCIEQVGAVFGQRILEHAMSLCQGKFDYLERLPDDILLRILSYLQLKDTKVLTQVSHRFRKLCNSEKFWEHTVRNRCAEFTSDMEDVANAMGWRKAFFTLFHGGSEKQQ
ncbi:F-box only protein 36a [Symphorus nematophorus]